MLVTSWEWLVNLTHIKRMWIMWLHKDHHTIPPKEKLAHLRAEIKRFDVPGKRRKKKGK